MKKFFHNNRILLLIVLVVATMMSVTRIFAQDNNVSNESILSYCAANGLEIAKDSPYADFQKSTEDIMEIYHQTINDKFNVYIKQMIAAQSSAAVSGETDPLSLPPAIDDATGLPAACTPDNYSTYCVANTLLTSPTYGYLTYEKVLNCRRSQMFDSSQQEDLWNQYVSVTTCLGGAESVLPPNKCTEEEKQRLEKQLQGTYQTQKALEISSRLDALTRERQNAKTALDTTLSAYDELRTAWPMHKKYMEIYSSLIKFRDKMVEIRNQVEQLPAKFIDATTTKCT
jgi:hypothetical protein